MSVKPDDAAGDEGTPSSEESLMRRRTGEHVDLQKELSLERLRKLKNDPSRQGDLERLRKEVTEPPPIAEVLEPIQDDKAVKTPPKRVGSLLGAWDAVLNASKVTISDKIDHTRKETNTPFKMTDGSGKVQSIIGDWEKIVMQKAATKEEVNESVKAAQCRIKQMDSVWPASPPKRNSAETFGIGSTHVYKLSELLGLSQDGADLCSSIRTLERLLAESNGKPVVLSTGVYGEKEGRPSINTTAVALQGEDGEAYIAVTVTVAKGHGYKNDDHVFGVHKISVFLSNDTLGESMPLLRREVNIVERENSYANTVFTKGLLQESPLGINTALTDQESPMFLKSAEDDTITSLTPLSSTRVSSPSHSPCVSPRITSPVSLLPTISPNRPLPLKRIASPSPVTPVKFTPESDTVCDIDMTYSAGSSGCCSAARSPTNIPVPITFLGSEMPTASKVEDSWVPHTVNMEGVFYYWNPYKGQYCEAPADVEYDPSVTQSAPTSPPTPAPLQTQAQTRRSSASNALKSCCAYDFRRIIDKMKIPNKNATRAPQQPVQAMEKREIKVAEVVEESHESDIIVSEGVTFKWDKASNAYYPLAMKVQIRGERI